MKEKIPNQKERDHLNNNPGSRKKLATSQLRKGEP
jgi:hypothetical protein